MNSAVSVYLEELYNDPIGIEEYKIKMLKSYFYPKINLILNCNLNNFKIGMSKNKNVIWFINDEDENTEILYDYENEKYYLRNKRNKEKIEIFIKNYIKYKNVDHNELNSKSGCGCLNCIII